MPSKAIAILNFNGLAHLQRFLPSVVEYTSSEATIIVIDNGSTDTSVEWLQSTYPQIRIVQLQQNHGFAGGYNEGIEQIDEDLLVLLNSDVEVTENWDLPLWSVLERPDVAAVQCKIRSVAQPDHFEYAGAAGGLLDKWAYPFCLGRILDVTEKDTGQYDEPRELFWASGAAMAVKRQVFRDFKGFNPLFFAHMEEIDLCWRWKRAGYKIMSQPSSIVYHLGGGTLNYQSKRKVYLNFRNSLITNYMNNGWIGSLCLYAIRVVLDVLAALNFLFNKQARYVLSILKAHLYCIKKFGRLRKQKRIIQKAVKDHSIGQANVRSGRAPFSIIVNYYLLNRKTVTDIVRKTGHPI